MSKFRLGQIYDPAFKKLSKQDRIDNLDAVAYKSENKVYTVNLTEEQVQTREHKYSKEGIKIMELEERKKEATKKFADSIKEIKSSSKLLAHAIKYKSEQREGTVFLIEDPDNQMMSVFDEEGVCIENRPFTDKERQRVIKLAN